MLEGRYILDPAGKIEQLTEQADHETDREEAPTQRGRRGAIPTSTKVAPTTMQSAGM